MLDRVIGELQQGLVNAFPWLDAAFGRAQRITRIINGKRVIAPACYCGGWRNHGENDYIEVGPDSKIGNFVYFEVDDPETIDAGIWGRTITSPFALVFWGDMRILSGELTARNIEMLKADFLYFLAGRMGWHLKQGRITTGRVYEQAQNIYKGYSLDEVDAQYLMHPYCGFRIEGTLTFDEICMEAPTPPAPETWYWLTKDNLFFITKDGRKIIVRH